MGASGGWGRAVGGGERWVGASGGWGRAVGGGERWYLGGAVDVVVAVKQQRGGLDVVLLRGDVQRGQADAAAAVALQQDGDDAVVALLERHRQRGEAVLHNIAGVSGQAQ